MISRQVSSQGENEIIQLKQKLVQMKSEQESEILKLSQNIAIHPNDDSIYNQRGQIFYQS